MGRLAEALQVVAGLLAAALSAIADVQRVARAPGWSAAALGAFAGERDDHPQDQDQAEEQADVAEYVKQRGAAAGTGGTSLFHVFGYAGLFFSLVLILRVIIAITREGI